MTYWLNDESRAFLNAGYLLPGVTPEERLEQMADAAQKHLPKHPWFKDKFLDYAHRGWMSFSSPEWSNLGTDRGLPISCQGSFVPDSMEGILETVAEIGMMSKHGGGTSAYFGAVRGRGAPIKPTPANPSGENGQSEGAVNFMRLFDTAIDVTKQGATRRGSFAAYLPIEHPDVREFLTIKNEGSPIQNLFFGITVSDKWMREMESGDRDKQQLWAMVLQSRSEKGLPYILFEDAVNWGAADVYRDKGMRITASNLCSEITLPTTPNESFICCLASMNLLHWDEWKDTDAVEVLTMFLDAVMSEFIEKTEDMQFFERMHEFAVRHRALGLGALGWHSYLQSKSIPFESLEANLLNNIIFKRIKERAYAASAELAQAYGEPEVLKGYGRRNTTLMAIAPTTSSSFILGQVSQSIEPYRSNYYVRDLAKRTVTFRNPYLQKVLEAYGRDDRDTWRSILENNGSVQHLTFLTEHERNVFKTFSEISQLDIIVQAATRQKHIDQSQSLNLMIHPATPTRDLNALHMEAWRRGIKTLYYQHSINAAQEFNRDLMNCAACEA